MSRSTLSDRARVRRRGLLREGRTLLRGIYATRVSLFAARRYALLMPPQLEPLSLPAWLHRWPGALPLVEPLGPRAARGRAELLRQRLQLAFVVGEASPSGARGIVREHDSGAAPAVLALLGVAALEALCGPTRLGATFWWSRREP
jgi:hypothetical protein